MGELQELSSSTAVAGGSPSAPPHLRTSGTSLSQQGQLGGGGTDKKNNLLETFVDDGVSIVRIGAGEAMVQSVPVPVPNRDPVAGGGLGRSVSSVTGTSRLRREPIAKPVRRSKSQLPGAKFVTNITHGGSVTLVSLNEGQTRVPGQFHPIGESSLPALQMTPIRFTTFSQPKYWPTH